MADYVSPDARRRIAGGLMAAQYAENPPTAPMGYDFDAAPLSPGLMNFAAQRGQPGVIQKTLGLIPGFDQDGKRGAQSWGNALMSTAQFPIDAVAGMGQALTAPARAYRGEFDPVSEEGVGEALNVAGNAMMGGLAAPKPRGVVGSAGGDLKGAALGAIPDTPGIRAYHGSPHDFDKFDLSKIGSGEGAQAYGHGLYFAENEGVAKSYRDGLTQVDGYQGTAADLIRHHSGDRVAALNEAKRGIDKYAATDPPTSREWQKVAGVLSDETYSGPGRMYEVNIKANPDDFLDWDKPISQQPKVAGLVGTDEQGRLILPNGERAPPDKLRGESFYRAFAEANGGGTQAGSDAIRQAGIPGIRYLDQGSRAGGEGSRNLVVFDDKLIEILRKYGLLGMAGGAAAAEYGGNSLMPSRPASPQYRPGDA